MIYDILTSENRASKDVFLDMAMEDFESVTWEASFVLDKSDMTVHGPTWRVSDSREFKYEYDEVAAADVPRWCRVMADKMKPRIVAEHFQALINEWKAAQEEEEVANNLG